MADTFTAKLGLYQYDPTLFYDVNKISADNLKVDNAFGTIICTSTTRPSTGLFNGMMLWETDTRRPVVRVAGAWVVIPTRCIVADEAARAAITTPYDGMTIYRQDRDWTEVYDGAAWRVHGTAHCTGTADRDAAITSPYNGQVATTTNTGTVWERFGGAWIAVYGTSGSSLESTQVASGTTTSGSFTATLTGGTTCSGTFIAPANGKVEIYNTAQVGNSNTGNLAICSHEVRTGAVVGSGTIVQAAAIENGVYSGATIRATAVTALSGLTPFATYNIQGMYVVTGTTGTFVNKRLVVRPAA